MRTAARATSAAGFDANLAARRAGPRLPALPIYSGSQEQRFCISLDILTSRIQPGSLVVNNDVSLRRRFFV
jgi:hypothetical protein